MEDEMDTKWIQEFDVIDKDYDIFYQEPVNQVELFLMYVDRTNTLFHIKKEKLNISTNVLEKGTLIEVLQKNMQYNEKTYRPISILQYNIDIDAKNVQNFIHNTDKYNFLDAKHSIESIKWNNTIRIFQDINSLYIIFYEKWYTTNTGTKKIYIENRRKLKNRRTKRRAYKGGHKNKKLKDKSEV